MPPPHGAATSTAQYAQRSLPLTVCLLFPCVLFLTVIAGSTLSHRSAARHFPSLPTTAPIPIITRHRYSLPTTVRIHQSLPVTTHHCSGARLPGLKEYCRTGHSFICLAYVLILPGRSSSDAVKQFESHAVAWTGHACQIVAASCHGLLTGRIVCPQLH